uniref:WD40 repeat-like protein n=1 Tax=Hirondellea gigas TaxID=1518452 RepID=A0A6A7G2B9_9CRUS
MFSETKTNDLQVPQCPNSITSVEFSPTENILSASSWDNETRIWSLNSNGTVTPKAQVKVAAPVLDHCWSSDGSRLFSACTDKNVYQWSPSAPTPSIIAQHAEPVKCVEFAENLLCTGSWDETVKFWDLKTPQPKLTLQMPERVYCMNLIYPVLIVGLAQRKVLTYDLRNASKPFKNQESPLKMQTRCIAIFPDQSGFCIGSIEGRVGVQHFAGDDKKNFAFKCHRRKDDVYSVNAISFHRTHGTFSTAGADGNFTFWDKNAKQRLKQFPQVNQSIIATAFNKDCNLFAYAASYDWSQGQSGYNSQRSSQIYVHVVADSDVRPRKAGF